MQKTKIVVKGFTPTNVSESKTPSPFLNRQSPVLNRRSPASELTHALNLKVLNESPELLHTPETPSSKYSKKRAVSAPPNTPNSLPEEAAALLIPIEPKPKLSATQKSLRTFPDPHFLPNSPPSPPILRAPHNTPSSFIGEIMSQIDELKI